MLKPESPEELAEALRCAAGRGAVNVCGGSTKAAMAGPVAPAETSLSTEALDQVLQYEPRDLTISVQAGIKFAALSRVLAEHRQMIPLDPPFAESATIGGVLASNGSGPRRRLYGGARDLVIGMKFATLEGKLVQAGGMVVKNVAGLDMAKLMIGSFGTLAAIAVVNFKLTPMPHETSTLLIESDELADLIAVRDRVLASVLQPAAIDLVKAADGFTLAIQAGGNRSLIERYQRELPEAHAVEGDAETAFWRDVREFVPDFLSANTAGAVVRVSCLLAELAAVIKALPGPALARAGSGVVYGCFPDAPSAAQWIRDAQWKAVVEFAPPEAKQSLDLWPAPASDLEIMKRVKQVFDPENLLNRGRLYGRI